MRSLKLSKQALESEVKALVVKREEDRELFVGLSEERERLMKENVQVWRENEELRVALVDLQGKLDEKEKATSLSLSSSAVNNNNNNDNNNGHDTVELRTTKDDVAVDTVTHHLSDTTTVMMEDLRTQLATESSRRVACEATLGELMQTMKTMEQSRAAAQAQNQTQKEALEHEQQRNQQQSKSDKDDDDAAAAATTSASADARALEKQQLLLNHEQQVASIHATHQRQLLELKEANDRRIAGIEMQVRGSLITYTTAQSILTQF